MTGSNPQPRPPRPLPELMAPVGSLDAGYAAFHYGADAVYAGLSRFSARADAQNLSLEELGELTAFAHAQAPARRVFVTLNTLIADRELDDLIGLLAEAVERGVDAVIVQDLGVLRVVRRHFPGLRLHASTQLAIHNRAGVEVLAALGVQRVTLARELTLAEVRDAVTVPGVEIEVFVHGALCYSYSGQCLLSSQLLGRSGNRGCCAYCCRDSYHWQEQGNRAGKGFLFSMKDLALADAIPELCRAGVASLKIEGRKKSPLYVAAVTQYYRRLLDGRLSPAERAACEADIRSIFSRPWTRLYLRSSHDQGGVVDSEFVGHRGMPAGTVAAVLSQGGRQARLRFRTARPLEKHDGLQIDIPGQGRPFGFAVDELRIVGSGHRGSGRSVFAAPAGAMIEVPLPPERPDLPPGAVVYHASSQEVKRRYVFERPKPGLFRCRSAVSLTVTVSADRVLAEAVLSPVAAHEPLRVEMAWPGTFAAARDPGQLAAAAHAAFASLGNTRLALTHFELRNPHNLFVPVSELNGCRRELVAACHQCLDTHLTARVTAIRAAEARHEAEPAAATASPLAWAIKVASPAYVDAFGAEDWAQVAEVVVNVVGPEQGDWEADLEHLATQVGRERLRLALPMVSRQWERAELHQRIRRLLAAGWRNWEAANLGAWSDLGLDPGSPGGGALDLSCDWSVYILNRAAVRQVLDMGASTCVASPEDTRENLLSLVAAFGRRLMVVIYQDTPLMISETCVKAVTRGGCARCSEADRGGCVELRTNRGDRFLAVQRGCRTVVLGQQPLCLAPHLPQLVEAGVSRVRADFVWRPYDPGSVLDCWRRLRQGQIVAGTNANFARPVQ